MGHRRACPPWARRLPSRSKCVKKVWDMRLSRNSVWQGPILCLLAGAATMPVAAQDAPEPAARSEPADRTALFDAAPITDAELASITGREASNWMTASNTNTAVVRDNSVGDNNVTGNVSLTDNAFQNVSGIAMVNFNTGNNSAINAAMSVNLQINYAQQPTLP